MTEILITSITSIVLTLVGSGSILGIYINKKIDKNAIETKEVGEINEKISELKTEWYDCLFEVERLSALKLRGRDINGDLDEAFEEYEKVHKELKNAYIKKSRMLKGSK